ncbi:MAG: hypothetical protein LBR65_03665 [Culturomica sp.]|jgi:antitoxin component YwqK of YwqJK toxin-antitoxin module|nr:hypothetical protein [Culturomica sp.]
MKGAYLIPFVCLLLHIPAGQAQEGEVKKGYYPDGKLRYEGLFLNGLPAGQVTHYHENGRIKAVMNHNGRETDAVLYDTGGEVSVSGRYIDRKKEGIWSYRKGERLLMTESYADNRLSGPSERFFPGGGVAERKEWRDGRLSGPWELFYEDGTLRLEARFSDGKLDGELKSYDPEGRLLVKGRYAGNWKEGVWAYYRADGTLKEERTYVQGVAENSEEELEENRQLDELIREGRRIVDPADFINDPLLYLRATGE